MIRKKYNFKIIVDSQYKWKLSIHKNTGSNPVPDFKFQD